MRKILMLAISIFFIVNHQTANAFDVRLLNETYSYSIYMGIHDINNNWGRIEGGYNQPFHQELFVDPLGGWVDADRFSLETESNGWVVYESSMVEGSGYSFVSGEWIFRPINPQNEMTFYFAHPSSYTPFYFSMNDLTDNIEMFNFTFVGVFGSYGTPGYIEENLGDMWKGSYQGTQNFPTSDIFYTINNLFFADHIYELKMGTMSQSGEDVWDSFIYADLTAVPEPSIIFLLSFISFLIFPIAKKQFIGSLRY